MTDDARRKLRDDKADNLQDARERYETALDAANRAAIGSKEFRDAMDEVRRAEEVLEAATAD